MAINETAGLLLGAYQSLTDIVPDSYEVIVSLFFCTVIIACASIFMFFFCKFLAKEDLLELNLKKYNWVQHPFFGPFMASFLYLMEYMILIPISIFLWFIGFTVLFIPIAVDFEASTIFFIGATMIAAVRITAYIKDEVSDQLAQLFPFTMLFIIIAEPNFFVPSMVITRIGEIFSMLHGIFLYIVFLTAVEFVLRIVRTIGQIIEEAS